MVVGDVVNGIGLVNTAFSFQPSAGTEIILTHIAVNSVWIYLGNAAGVGLGYLIKSGNTTTSYITGTIGAKICINNTNFIYFEPSAAVQANYSGIQIK